MKARKSERARQEREYSRRRAEYLLDHPWCEGLPGCGSTASEVHHKRGRLGPLLLDTRYWLPLCHDCHQWVTEHPAEAIRLGLSESRHDATHRFIPDAGGSFCTTCNLPFTNWRHKGGAAA